MRVTRRRFVTGAGASLSATALGAPQKPTTGPTILVRKDFRIRVLGTHVTLQEAIRQRAQEDLGITVEFQPGGSAAVLHQASTQPESFDVYEQWSNSIRVLWDAGTIQPIERSRIEHWDEINNLSKTGRLTSSVRQGRGDAPHRLLFVQRGGSLGSNPTEALSFLPYVHNADSIGYDAAAIGERTAYETETWGMLYDERYSGRVALVNAPTIGIFDAALAAEATGRMHFDDIGDMSRGELDRLFDILIDFKSRGHFRGTWSSVPQSVDYMARDGVVVESMFSPAVAMLRGAGTRCLYAAPREGYRAWHGVLCLSAKADGPTRDAAYAYMNWWLSGWPGAFIARQGYYISTPELSRPHLDADEWDYWYAGEPARRDLPNPSGEIAVREGEIRRGGSYEARLGNVAVWNTVMPNYEYSLLKWNEFLLA